MHSSQEINKTTDNRIGLIAGQGDLPRHLISKWKEMGLTPVVVGLYSITPQDIPNGQISAWFSIGQAGHILKFFRQQSVSQVVMAGGLKRPNFWTLRMDFLGLRIITKFMGRKIGDDRLLKIIRQEIEGFGIKVRGAHEFLPDILSPVGLMGAISPDIDDYQIIQDGFATAKKHGQDDKGQAIIINAHGVCGLENHSGTNTLIKSCNHVHGCILVKVSKPQQDLALDMPTIGLSTVRHAIKAGLKGIVVEAHKTIILDRADVITLCDKNGLFLMGIEGQEERQG